MTDARYKAKQLLNHYLQLALNKANCKTDNDTTTEIDEIVDHVIDAAVEETFKRITSSMLSSKRGI